MRVLADPCFSNSNPYVNLLYDGLNSLNVTVKPLTLRRAFQGADICHVHWPERGLTESSFLGSLNISMRLLIKVVVAKARGAKVIWTVHNLQPHEQSQPVAWVKLFYYVWRKLVDGGIFLSHSSRSVYDTSYTPISNSEIVPHGHYCSIYEGLKPTCQFKSELNINDEDFVFGHYGLIRSYKNIPYLIEQFSQLKGANNKLIIAGKVRNGEEALGETIRRLAAADDRISFIPRFLTDSEMLELYSFTDLAVFPYTRILNSGSAILALSLGCPVLVTKSPSMSELKDLVGESVCLLNDLNDLTERMLEHRSGGMSRVPVAHLNSLNWPELSHLTLNFYKEVCSSKK